MSERNVLGGELEPCGTDPVTGFFRDGCCNTGPEDVGSHTVCAVDELGVPRAPARDRQRPEHADAAVPVPRAGARRPVVRHRARTGCRPTSTAPPRRWCSPRPTSGRWRSCRSPCSSSTRSTSRRPGRDHPEPERPLARTLDDASGPDVLVVVSPCEPERRCSGAAAKVAGWTGSSAESTETVATSAGSCSTSGRNAIITGEPVEVSVEVTDTARRGTNRGTTASWPIPYERRAGVALGLHLVHSTACVSHTTTRPARRLEISPTVPSGAAATAASGLRPAPGSAAHPLSLGQHAPQRPTPARLASSSSASIVRAWEPFGGITSRRA